jgi:hypothetical protein
MRKTIARLERKYPGVIEEVSLEGPEDGYWLYLTPGWIRQGTGTHCVHEWTAKDLIAGMREVEKCDCEECRSLIAETRLTPIEEDDRDGVDQLALECKRGIDRRTRG